MSFSVDGTTSDTNDFWRIKIKYYFNEILDCNDDRKVGSDDFKLILDFYKGLKHISETSQKYMDFEKYIEKWKTNLLAGEHIFVTLKIYLKTDIFDPILLTIS